MNLFAWGASVIIGGIIGYVTNWLAIKMLFRPYNPVMVFGKKLPFTPGVIPKERYRLSESVGNVITEDLLTVSDFRTYFSGDKFKNEITTFLETSIQNFLDMPLEKIRNAGTSTTASALFIFFKDAMLELLDTPGISTGLQIAFERGKEELLGHPLTDYVPKSVLSKFVANFADEQKRKSAIVKVLGYLPGTSGEHAVPLLRNYLDADLLKIAVTKLFAEFAPSVQKDFIQYCRQPDIHKQLESLAVKIIKGYIQKLNSLQRLIINIGGFDNALYDSIPGTVDEAIDAIGGILVNSDIHARIADALVSRYTGTKLPVVIDNETEKTMEVPVVAEIIDAFLASVNIERLGEAWYEYCSYYTVAELANAEAASKGNGYFLQSLLNAFKDKDNAVLAVFYKALNVSVHAFLDTMSTNSTGTIGTFIQPSEEKVKNLSSHAAGLVVSILTDQVPVLLKLLDIKTLVKSKLDSLDMAMIENLIVKVMNRELKAITMLGGVLGALIGLVQAFLLQFLR